MSKKNIEIERKWLVDKKNIKFDLKKYKSKNIIQGYLIKYPSVRIRKSNNKYYFCVKTIIDKNDLVRNEFEFEIKKSDFDSLIKACENHIIKKTRYIIPYEKYNIELDIFNDRYEGLIYAEIEFNNELEAKNFKAPNWFSKELTGKKNYTNVALAYKK